MRKICTLFFFFFTLRCLLFIDPALSGEARQIRVGKLEYVSGKVLVFPTGSKSQVFSGDRIRTYADSLCEILLFDESILRLNEKSILSVFREPVDKTELSVIRIEKGTVWISAMKADKKKGIIKVLTPTASFILKGTKAAVYAGKKQTTIKVYADAEKMEAGPYVLVQPKPVTMEKWVEIVRSLKSPWIKGDGNYHAQKISEEEIKRDEWIRWNLLRDKRMEEQAVDEK